MMSASKILSLILTKIRFILVFYGVVSLRIVLNLFKQAQIDDCTWNPFPNMTEGSDGVTCPNLDDLYAYANKMNTGQKITCRRFLKDMD